MGIATIGLLVLSTEAAGADVISASGAGFDPPAPTPWTVYALAVGGFVVLVLAALRRWHGLADAPERPRVLSPEVSFGLAAGMVLIQPLGVTLAQRAWNITASPPETLADQVRLLLGAYGFEALVAIVAIALLCSTPRRAPDTRPSLARAALAAVPYLLAVGLIVQAVSFIATVAANMIADAPPDHVAHRTLRLMLDEPSRAWLAASIAMVVIVAPILEEVLYRGLLQDAIRRATGRPWLAITVTSVVFTAMHASIADWHALPPLFVLSLGLGWAYERTGRLVTPILMHAGFNLVNLLVAMGQG